jgi:hypothetical protein
MRKAKYSGSQIMAMIKQNEAGESVPDLCREHGIGSQRIRTDIVSEVIYDKTDYREPFFLFDHTIIANRLFI